MKCILILTFIGLFLVGCGGSSSGSPTVTLNVPALPTPPVARLILPQDYVGFFIGVAPLGTDPFLATSQQYTQMLYTLDADNTITPVPFINAQELAWDLTGNVSFTEVENIIPLDIMVMNEDYVMLTLYYRDLDTDPDNDYFNLLVDLRSGVVSSAPVGLNVQGNSGRSTLTQAGRDYFPPDSRWNDTGDLYVISVDYEALDQMEEVPLGDHEEIVDHHVGVPCPTSDTGDDTEDESGTNDEAVESAETNDEAAETDSTIDSDETTPEENNTETPTSTCTGPTGGTITPTTTAELETDTTTTNAFIATSSTITHRATAESEEPTPSAIYRMGLGEGNQFTLDRISLEDDRPGLGQFVVSRSGILIYRNLDGGDNSYRVLLEECEGITGRLSTVLLAPYTTLIVADDDAGNSSIFEVTERGINKLIFSCNGNVIRDGYSGYTARIASLRLPYNSPSISSYDYIYPYFINTSCQGGRIFPRPIPEVEILNPLPSIPGLPAGDTRGLRKSQMFDNKLYCIGYDSNLLLAIAQLDTTASIPVYEFLDIDFGLWLPDFDTLHMVSDNHVIFTGTSRASTEVKTVMLNDSGEEFDLSDTLLGLKVSQQIEITPPVGTTYSSTLVEE